jgi:hypothetical protein
MASYWLTESDGSYSLKIDKSTLVQSSPSYTVTTTALIVVCTVTNHVSSAKILIMSSGNVILYMVSDFRRDHYTYFKKKMSCNFPYY